MRRNIRDDFEKVYLRFNQAQRDIPKTDIEELKSEDFIKVCKYTTKTHFQYNKSFYTRYGIDSDDIFSLSQIYGACFLGQKKLEEGYDRKRYYLMMIANIKQRLNRYRIWVSKKMVFDDFIVREKDAREYTTSSLFEDGNTHEGANLYIDGVSMYGTEKKPSLQKMIDEKNRLKDFYDEKYKDNKGLNLEEKRSKGKIKNKIEILSSEISKEKNSRRILRNQEAKMFANLRNELKANPDKYEENLVFYACSRSVSPCVRKVARRYCTSFGIDYKMKIKKYIPDCSSADFDI